MRAVVAVGLLLVAGTAGCQHRLRLSIEDDNCPPPTAHRPPRPAPPADEEVVVRTPPPKMVVDVQDGRMPAAGCPANGQPCPPGPAAPPAGFVAQQTTHTGFVNGTPVMVPNAGFGVPVTAQVRERTRLGFVLDTIRIPIPFLRPIPVQQPAEATFQMPAAPPVSAGYSTAMVMAPPAGFVMPSAGYPIAPAGFQMVPNAGMVVPNAGMMVPNAGYAAPPAAMVAPTAGYTMVPQQAVGYQQVTVHGQVPAHLAAQWQPSGTGAGCPPDRLKLTEQQLAELKDLCERLKGMERR